MQEYSGRERREDLVATEEVCYEIEVLLGDILGRVFWGYGAKVFWRGVWPRGGAGGGKNTREKTEKNQKTRGRWASSGYLQRRV